MRTYIAGALIALSATAHAQAVGADWRIDPKASGCAVLQREPGSTNRIEITRFPSTDEVGVSIADVRLKVDEFTPLRNVGVALEPGTSRTVDGRLQRDTDGRPAAISAWVDDPSFLTEFARASAVILSHKALEIRRIIRSPAQAVRGLADCEESKLRAWGIDPSYLRSLRKRPKPVQPLSRLINLNEYPPGYLLNNVGGEVVVRVTISSDGRAQDCTGLGRRIDRFFLQAVCDKLRKHAMFEPAVDQQGRAIAAPYIIAASFGVES